MQLWDLSSNYRFHGRIGWWPNSHWPWAHGEGPARRPPVVGKHLEKSMPVERAARDRRPHARLWDRVLRSDDGPTPQFSQKKKGNLENQPVSQKYAICRAEISSISTSRVERECMCNFTNNLSASFCLLCQTGMQILNLPANSVF